MKSKITNRKKPGLNSGQVICLAILLFGILVLTSSFLAVTVPGADAAGTCDTTFRIVPVSLKNNPFQRIRMESASCSPALSLKPVNAFPPPSRSLSKTKTRGITVQEPNLKIYHPSVQNTIFPSYYSVSVPQGASGVKPLHHCGSVRIRPPPFSLTAG